MKYPPQKVIAVDVDGTLHNNGTPNAQVIAWCRAKKAEGFKLMLWSARGEAHAVRAAHHFGCFDVFDLICSKPGFILDDQGWGWIRYTHIVRDITLPPPPSDAAAG